MLWLLIEIINIFFTYYHYSDIRHRIKHRNFYCLFLYPLFVVAKLFSFNAQGRVQFYTIELVDFFRLMSGKLFFFRGYSPLEQSSGIFQGFVTKFLLRQNIHAMDIKHIIQFFQCLACDGNLWMV
jgi:hypothetical protein